MRAGRWVGATIALLAGGCAAPRSEQFHQFAQAGLAYAGAVNALMQQAGQASIDADSAVLERAREGEDSKEERQATVLEHDKLLIERVAILNDLDRHAQLLAVYFTGLDALAVSDPAPGAGAAAKELVDAMGVLSARIRTARIGAVPVASFSGAVTQIAVAKLRSAALERELRTRGDTIERELDAQLAAMQAIAAALRVDLELVVNQQELNEIIEPYRNDAKLTRTWARRRHEILGATPAMDAAHAAVAASASLKAAFTELAAGRLSSWSLAGLLADVDAVLRLLERVKGLQPPG